MTETNIIFEYRPLIHQAKTGDYLHLKLMDLDGKTKSYPTYVFEYRSKEIFFVHEDFIYDPMKLLKCGNSVLFRVEKISGKFKFYPIFDTSRRIFVYKNDNNEYRENPKHPKWFGCQVFSSEDWDKVQCPT